MALRVASMEKMETTTAIMMAICCFQGVAPMRWPVLRSCEVSPALEAAMQTTPPMVMARAPKAGAVQPLTRKMAAVAISVAMVMPETGEAELPTMPTMRGETVTKRKAKTATRRATARLGDGGGAGVGGGERGGAEEVDGGNEDEPGEDTAGEHDGGDANADDVADAEVFGGAVGADGGAFEQVLRAQVEVAVGSRGPEGEEVFVLEEGVDAAETEARADAGGGAAGALAGDESGGARGVFCVGEVGVV